MKTIDCVKENGAYDLEQNIEDDDFVSKIKRKIQEIHHLIKSLANEDKQLVKKFLTESVHEIFLLLDAKQPDQDDITTPPIKSETNLPKEVPDHAQDEQIQDLITDLPSSISDQDLSEESAKALNEAFIQHSHENTQDNSTNIRTSNYQQNESNSCGIQPLPWSSHEINETVKSDHAGSSETIDLNIVKNEVNHEVDEYSGCKNNDNTPDLPMEIDNAETEDATYSSLMDEIDDIKPKSNIPFIKDGTPDTCTTGSEDVSSLLSFLPQLSPYIKFDPREGSVGENEGYIHLTLERTDGTIQNLKVSATAALSAGESGQIEENRQNLKVTATAGLAAGESVPGLIEENRQMKANTGEKQLILIQKDLMNKENNADIPDDTHDDAEPLVASQDTIIEKVEPNVSTLGRPTKQHNTNTASSENPAGTEPLIATQVTLTAPETLDPDVSSPRGRPPKPDKYDSVTLDNGQKVFVCHICKSTVQTQYAMMVHLRTHSGEKPFSCDICGKSFTTKGNLKHHLVRHDNAKPFECKFCKKTFKEKRVLMVHERIHNGERPYKCHICDKLFTQSGSLKEHMLVHSGQKPHLCDLCGQEFRGYSSLRAHKLRHLDKRNYNCDQCDKSFITKGDLSRHQLMHSGNRPFMCSLCPKRFTRLSYLKEHMNGHLGHKPFSCSECNASFPDSVSLSRHKKKHKAEKEDSNKLANQSELQKQLKTDDQMTSLPEIIEIVQQTDLGDQGYQVVLRETTTTEDIEKLQTLLASNCTNSRQTDGVADHICVPFYQVMCMNPDTQEIVGPRPTEPVIVETQAACLSAVNILANSTGQQTFSM